MTKELTAWNDSHTSFPVALFQEMLIFLLFLPGWFSVKTLQTRNVVDPGQHTFAKDVYRWCCTRRIIKRAGVDPANFTLAEVRAVFAKIMPGEMEKRGCSEVIAVCDAVMKSVESNVSEDSGRGAAARDEIMRRIGNA